MKRLIIILFFIVAFGCSDSMEFNCTCEYTFYQKDTTKDIWVEINKITRITKCGGKPFFLVNNNEFTKTVINCN